MREAQLTDKNITYQKHSKIGTTKHTEDLLRGPQWRDLEPAQRSGLCVARPAVGEQGNIFSKDLIVWETNGLYVGLTQWSFVVARK